MPKNLNNLSFNEQIHQAIRVNHAGEYGAKQIYAGQMLAFKLKKDQETLALIEKMKAQEDLHFDYFNQKIIDEKVRPTLMQPIWRIAGFVLGFGTALISKKAAMACTVAVEEVIDEHYQNQIETLPFEDFSKDQLKNKKPDDNLKDKIEQFQKEELEHKDIGLENQAESLKFYQPFSFIIKKASQLAISISSKI